MHCSHLGCCGDCRESMAAARQKASKDGDADLCSCGLAANHRVGIRRRLRLERLILPGRPARCQSEAHAEATAELLAPTWSGSALHAKIPKIECND